MLTVSLACEAQTYFRSSLLSAPSRERSDDRKYVCASQATVSSDVSIQGLQWQPLSVHLWAYCYPPTAHDINGAWCAKGRPHHKGTYTFLTLLWVFLRPLRFWPMKEEWRKQVQRLNVTTQWRDHLNWGKNSNHSQHDLTSFLKTPVSGPTGVWIQDLRLCRLVLSQLS